MANERGHTATLIPGGTPGCLAERYISPRFLDEITALPPLADDPEHRSVWDLRERATLGARIVKSDGALPLIVADVLGIDEALIVAELTYERKDTTAEQILRRADSRAIARAYALLDQVQDRMAEQLASGEQIRFGELTKGTDVLQRMISTYRGWGGEEKDTPQETGKTLADFLKGGGKVTLEGPKAEEQAIDVTGKSGG